MTLAILPTMGWAQNSIFTLKATVDGIPASTKAYLSYEIRGKFVIDSAMMDSGSFIFRGIIPYPLKAQLLLDRNGVGLTRLGNSPDVLIFFLDKGEIDLSSTDSIKNSIITGSRINALYIKYKAFIAGPTENKKERQLQYIKLNPSSEFSLGALHEIAGSDIDVVSIEPLYNGLSDNIRNTIAGKEFAKSLEAARATSVGAMAPVFTQSDVNGKPVSLADFRGKYVLLDFWASWCGPCRAENPNVAKVYQQYHDKNFAVLGVSLDRPGKKDAWLAAIKADGLDWTQVSDLNFWDNQVAKQYGIGSIPKNFLIDPTGKIIAKNLRGEELREKLAEILPG